MHSFPLCHQFTSFGVKCALNYIGLTWDEFIIIIVIEGHFFVHIHHLIAESHNPLLSVISNKNQLNSLDSQSFSSGSSSDAATVSSNNSFEQLLLSSSSGGCYTLQLHFYYSCSPTVWWTRKQGNKETKKSPSPTQHKPLPTKRSPVPPTSSKTSTHQPVKQAPKPLHVRKLHWVRSIGIVFIAFKDK